MSQPQAKLQRNLFDEPLADPGVRLPLEVQQQLRQALVQWIQSMAKIIRVEDNDEQDQR